MRMMYVGRFIGDPHTIQAYAKKVVVADVMGLGLSSICMQQ